MWANRILMVGMFVVAPVIIPIRLVSTFVLGVLVWLTFDLLLIPISVVWVVCFLGPLLGLSWIWDKVPFLRILLAVLGIPLALIAETFCCLMPSMGDMDALIQKLCLCRSWPYTLDCFLAMLRRTAPENPKVRAILGDIFKNDVYCRAYLSHLGVWDGNYAL